MRVGRWLTVIPLVFLLQVSFCGQQDLDSALVTLEVRDGDGALIQEARILLDGELVDEAPPVELSLEPWVAHRVEVQALEGWVFLPGFVNLVLEPGSSRSVIFEASSLAGTLHVSARDLWGGELTGAGILVNGELQAETAPASLTLPAGPELRIALIQQGWEFDPGELSIVLEADGEAEAGFEGVRDTRVVLVEDFSNTACVGCPEAEEAAWTAAGQASGELLPVSFHLYWPAPFDPFYLYDTEMNQRRHVFYGTFYTLPNIFVDGDAVSDPQDAGEILAAAEERLALAPKLALRVRSERQGDEIAVTVDGKVLADPGTGDWRIFYGLLEAEIELEEDGGNGQTHFRNVVRHLNEEGGLLGEPFEAGTGEFFQYSRVFLPDFVSVAAEQLFAFVFVQAEGSREILDAARETHGGP